MLGKQLHYFLTNEARQPSNLTNEKKQAFGNLSKNKEIIIKHADKGNYTVVLDKSDYDSRINDLL